MNRIIGGFLLALVAVANLLGIDIGIKDADIPHVVATLTAAIGTIIFLIGTIQRIIKELKTGKRKWYTVVLAMFSLLKSKES